MKFISLIMLSAVLTSCSGLASFWQDPISISQNQAIEISVDKDAILNGRNLSIALDVQNPQPPK